MNITKAEAKVIMRARYDAGTLSAQAPKPKAAYHSVQNGITYACAIGALFPNPKELESGVIYQMSWGLINNGDLVVDDEEWFNRAQQLHDLWITTGNSSDFLEHIR
jgi:hypothetical protein